MPDITLTTVVTMIVVALLLAVPFIAARLPRSRQTSPRIEQPPPRHSKDQGPGAGFTYALVPPGGHPDKGGDDQKGSWQWCLAFIPEETADGGADMPPWWAPAPPWDSTPERFTQDAEALQAVFEETKVYPVAKSKAG